MTDSKKNIPKIIHHVWPGDDEFKSKFHQFRLSWMKHHPDWTFYFWRIDNLPESIASEVREIVNSDVYNYTVKSDVLRYDLLRIYGGVYVDTDMECLKPIDDFLHLDFFAGKEDENLICPSIMGCIKKSPIMNKVVTTCIANVLNTDVAFANKSPNVVTGPKMLTPVLNKFNGVPGLHIFESEYFYPIGCSNRNDLHLETPNAYTKHHWSGQDSDGWVNRQI